MKAPTRVVMVSAATAAVVVAGWQVRPGSATDQADAVLVTTPATVVSAVAAPADPGATVVVDQGSSEVVEGYLSAAPLDIDPTQSAAVGPKPQAAVALDCWSYISEEIRRDEAGLIDWDALDTYVELSADDYANLEIEFVRFDDVMLVDGERPSFVDMGGAVDIGSLDPVRLLAVTDRCWELGVYEEISESIYAEIYGDE